MTKCKVSFSLVACAIFLLASCGNDDDMIALAGNADGSGGQASALYAKAKAADTSGKRSSAIKLYNKLADSYPLSEDAANARYRQAELLRDEGKILKSFDAYQQFLVRYRGSGRYADALAAQARMAQSAADGDVKNSFAGLRTNLETKRIAEMLGQVRDNAPRSVTAAKAQFTLGELYQGKREYKESIEAYRRLVRDQPMSIYSAEALFRVGVVLMEEAERGNQNRATLDLAGEAFEDYLIQYPGHAKNSEARRLSKVLKGRDLERSLEIARFYDKSGQTESAKIYYREVLRRSASGSAHDAAKSRLRDLGEKL